MGDIPIPGSEHKAIATLVVLPLKIQKDRFVFTLTANGRDGFSGRIGDLNDFDAWMAKFNTAE